MPLASGGNARTEQGRTRANRCYQNSKSRARNVRPVTQRFPRLPGAGPTPRPAEGGRRILIYSPPLPWYHHSSPPEEETGRMIYAEKRVVIAEDRIQNGRQAFHPSLVRGVVVSKASPTPWEIAIFSLLLLLSVYIWSSTGSTTFEFSYPLIVTGAITIPVAAVAALVGAFRLKRRIVWLETQFGRTRFMASRSSKRIARVTEAIRMALEDCESEPQGENEPPARPEVSEAVGR